MNISERLRRLRLKAKKTLNELSKALNVSLNTVYRWEHELSIPRKSALRKIADYYDVPFEWLLHGSYGDENGKYIGEILNPENETDQKILKMIKYLPERSKYRILGYIERMCVENE